MKLLDDTIAAISTPLGTGGIGIVRISGNDAIRIAEGIFISTKGKKVSSLKSYRMTHGYIVDQKTEDRGQRTENRTFEDKKIRKLETHNFTISQLYNFHIIDEVLLSVMRAPSSYTKEDVVEINCHGGFLPLRNVLEIVLNKGARLAEPGEFTLRAFLNGRIDLTQAEAVADLISAKTEESSRIAAQQLSGELSMRIKSIQEDITVICSHIEAYIDFPEDEIEPDTYDDILRKMNTVSDRLQRLSETYESGKFFRDGISIAIVGKPNVGKSSLLNAFLEKDRAIVTALPGTTRDTIEEYINIKGFPVRIIDTAGIREAHNLAEKEGVNRSLKAIDGADIVLSLFDCSKPLSSEDMSVMNKTHDKNTIFILNKCDLPSVIKEKYLFKNKIINHQSSIINSAIKISAKKRTGIDTLKESIINRAIKGQPPGVGLIITNIRHKHSIDEALEAMKKAKSLLTRSEPLEIVAIELRNALDRIGEIIGAVTTDDILNRIFSEFCIGK